jgi:hypothetical protein
MNAAKIYTKNMFMIINWSMLLSISKVEITIVNFDNDIVLHYKRVLGDLTNISLQLP